MNTSRMLFTARVIDPAHLVGSQRFLDTDKVDRTLVEFSTPALAHEFYDEMIGRANSVGYPDENKVTVRTVVE